MINATEFDFGSGPVRAHRHAHGGGWVADSARVADSAYVGPSARVSDNAWVHGDARVSGHARVYGNARVYDKALVFDNAQVYGDARVGGNARVYADAWVYDTARVYGDARVGGNARLFKSSDYLLIGPIGSREACMTWTRSDNCIDTGCFRGTVDEFLEAVRETHGDNEHAKAYRAAVKFISALEQLP